MQAAGTTSTARDGAPRAPSAPTTPRSCCSPLHPDVSRRARYDDGDRSMVRRLLEDLRPRRLLGRIVRHRQPAPDALPSWSARPTSRSSTRDETARPAARPPAHCRSCHSPSTTRAASSPGPASIASSAPSPGTKPERAHGPKQRGLISGTSRRCSTGSAAGRCVGKVLHRSSQPLLVPVGRDRPLQLPGPVDHRDLPDVLLRRVAGGADLRRRVHATPRCRSVGGVRLGDAHLVRSQRRPVDPARCTTGPRWCSSAPSLLSPERVR